MTTQWAHDLSNCLENDGQKVKKKKKKIFANSSWKTHRPIKSLYIYRLKDCGFTWMIDYWMKPWFFAVEKGGQKEKKRTEKNMWSRKWACDFKFKLFFSKSCDQSLSWTLKNFFPSELRWTCESIFVCYAFVIFF